MTKPKKSKRRRDYEELHEAEPDIDIPELPSDVSIPRARIASSPSRRETPPNVPTRVARVLRGDPSVATTREEEGEKTVAHASERLYTGDASKGQATEEVSIVSEEETQCLASQQVDEVLKALFAGLPEDPKARLDAVVALQRAFRREAVKLLQPSINNILRSPPASFVEKQDLASHLNQAFHELGIAARNDDITQPCSIVSLKSQGSKAGWLKLQTRKSPRQRSRPSTDLLGEVELIEAVREERFGREK